MSSTCMAYKIACTITSVAKVFTSVTSLFIDTTAAEILASSVFKLYAVNRSFFRAHFVTP